MYVNSSHLLLIMNSKHKPNLVTRPRGEKNYREDHDTEVKRPGRDTLQMMMKMMMILTVDADDFDHSKRKERQGLHLHLHQHSRDEKHH